MEFVRFWLENVGHAWHFGHGIFWEIAGPVEMVTIGITAWAKWQRKRKGESVKEHELPKDHWWNYWENNLFFGSLALALLAFFVFVDFVAPYERFKDQKERAESAETNATGLSKKLEITSNELHETQIKYIDSEAARIAQLEREKAVSGPVPKWVLSEGAKARIKEVLENLSKQRRQIQMSIVCSDSYDDSAARFYSDLRRLFHDTKHLLGELEEDDLVKRHLTFHVSSKQDKDAMALISQLSSALGQSPDVIEMGPTNSMRIGLAAFPK